MINQRQVAFAYPRTYSYYVGFYAGPISWNFIGPQVGAQRDIRGRCGPHKWAHLDINAGAGGVGAVAFHFISHFPLLSSSNYLIPSKSRYHLSLSLSISLLSLSLFLLLLPWRAWGLGSAGRRHGTGPRRRSAAP